MIVELIRKTLALTDGEPVAWLVGIEFLAAFENEGVVVATRMHGHPEPTDAELSPPGFKGRVSRHTIGGIPFVCSRHVQRNAAFLLDGQCRVLKQITIEAAEAV